MPSDQQKMYDHASNLVKLLSSEISEEDAISQIGEIVRDAVARVQIRRAVTNSIPIHVPAIILSAAAEFDLAYGAGGDSMPKLSRICENDERASSRSLYQVPIYTRHPTTPMLVVEQALPYLPITCDQCQNRQQVCKMTSILSCDACCSDQVPCTIATQPLAFDALFRQLSGMAAQIQQFAATSKGIDTHYPPAIGKRIKVEEGGFIHNTA